ncbi:hypothetical protein MAR_018363 [Mya arenaria]|uniref:ATP synthase F0 subunit 8 n=1 Tax=Mya arenaria TaxID=6604 RepID=A0ABY7EEE4_MYAAR|nr:hypothetical protein MAR_018363 [Mya arenaria]
MSKATYFIIVLVMGTAVTFPPYCATASLMAGVLLINVNRKQKMIKKSTIMNTINQKINVKSKTPGRKTDNGFLTRKKKLDEKFSERAHVAIKLRPEQLGHIHL